MKKKNKRYQQGFLNTMLETETLYFWDGKQEKDRQKDRRRGEDRQKDRKRGEDKEKTEERLILSFLRTKYFELLGWIHLFI